jgi:hypothetical protein
MKKGQQYGPDSQTYFSQPNLENNELPGIKNTVYNQTPGRQPTDKIQNLQTLYGEDASHSGVERISGL